MTDENKFQRTEPHECQRCGMCCRGKGDLAFGCDTIADNEDCPMLRFDGDMAVCMIEEQDGHKKSKRQFCQNYPADGELCERELKEAGLWKEYIK